MCVKCLEQGQHIAALMALTIMSQVFCCCRVAPALSDIVQRPGGPGDGRAGQKWPRPAGATVC